MGEGESGRPVVWVSMGSYEKRSAIRGDFYLNKAVLRKEINVSEITGRMRVFGSGTGDGAHSVCSQLLP